MAACAGSLAKFLLSLINFGFILTAITLIILGYRIRLMQQSNDNVIQSSTIDWHTLSTWIMVIGAVLIIISAFGFAATICESICMLNMYAYFLVGCSLLLVITYLTLLCYTNRLISEGEHYFDNLVANYTKDNQARRLVDMVQLNMYCCGTRSIEDWHGGEANGTNETTTNRTHQIPFHSSLITSTSILGNLVIPSGYYPASCCGKSSVDMNNNHSNFVHEIINDDGSITSIILCPSEQLIYYDGCFSPVQISRIKHYAHSSFQVLILSMILLLAISCCLERDYQLRTAKRINTQYATHLETCRAQMPHSAFEAHFGAGAEVPGFY